jgi:glucose-6-phosphate-specific signal transduction histidine kinase
MKVLSVNDAVLQSLPRLQMSHLMSNNTNRKYYKLYYYKIAPNFAFCYEWLCIHLDQGRPLTLNKVPLMTHESRRRQWIAATLLRIKTKTHFYVVTFYKHEVLPTSGIQMVALIGNTILDKHVFGTVSDKHVSGTCFYSLSCNHHQPLCLRRKLIIQASDFHPFWLWIWYSLVLLPHLCTTQPFSYPVPAVMLIYVWGENWYGHGLQNVHYFLTVYC